RRRRAEAHREDRRRGTALLRRRPRVGPVPRDRQRGRLGAHVLGLARPPPRPADPLRPCGPGIRRRIGAPAPESLTERALRRRGQEVVKARRRVGAGRGGRRCRVRDRLAGSSRRGRRRGGWRRERVGAGAGSAPYGSDSIVQWSKQAASTTLTWSWL